MDRTQQATTAADEDTRALARLGGLYDDWRVFGGESGMGMAVVGSTDCGAEVVARLVRRGLAQVLDGAYVTITTAGFEAYTSA